jgi:WhiB family redox-sensing transcriptional regulator
MSERADLLRVLVERPAWMERAACKGMTDIFYPEGPGASARAPMAICEGCSVTRECLGYAIATKDAYGVWGGMAPGRRRRVRRAVQAEIEEGSYLRWVSTDD